MFVSMNMCIGVCANDIGSVRTIWLIKFYELGNKMVAFKGFFIDLMW